MKKPLIIITGPTASGKTALSVELAKKIGGEIISADLSDSGYLAVCSDAAGYKGAVTVYDTSGKAVYVWYSGTGYLVRAAVSPDGKHLAALCLQDSGSVVHTFSLTSADERGSAECADELFADLFWRGGKVCCVSQTRLAFFDDNAKLTAEYPFGDLYLYLSLIHI